MRINALNRKPFGVSAAVLSVTSLTMMVGGCSEDEPRHISKVNQALAVECVDDAENLPDMSWICPEDLTVECNDPEGDGTAVDLIHSEPPEENACSDVVLSVEPEGPFAVGTHDIEISTTVADGGAGTALLCEAELRVVDTLAPEVLHKRVELWPPNHKWHAISAEDCFHINDRCDPNVEAVVLWATSDEPNNDTGDGNTEPDMKFAGCDGVQLRAERRGPSNGRVYRLGWQLTDDSGHMIEATCEVVVPHDQGHGEARAADASADAPAVELENSAECRAPDGGMRDR